MRPNAHQDGFLKCLSPLTLAWTISVLLLATAMGHCDGITKDTDLGFGAIVPYSGGTVTVTPLSVRSATGGVLLLPTSIVSPSAATFTVTGASNATYSITLPPDGAVLLSDGANHNMAVDTFTSNPNATGGLSGASPGSQTLRVGATLHVGAMQPPGKYTGSYDVTVAFD